MALKSLLAWIVIFVHCPSLRQNGWLNEHENGCWKLTTKNIPIIFYWLIHVSTVLKGSPPRGRTTHTRVCQASQSGWNQGGCGCQWWKLRLPTLMIIEKLALGTGKKVRGSKVRSCLGLGNVGKSWHTAIKYSIIICIIYTYSTAYFCICLSISSAFTVYDDPSKSRKHTRCILNFQSQKMAAKAGPPTTGGAVWTKRMNWQTKNSLKLTHAACSLSDLSVLTSTMMMTATTSTRWSEPTTLGTLQSRLGCNESTHTLFCLHAAISRKHGQLLGISQWATRLRPGPTGAKTPNHHMRCKLQLHCRHPMASCDYKLGAQTSGEPLKTQL